MDFSLSESYVSVWSEKLAGWLADSSNGQQNEDEKMSGER